MADRRCADQSVNITGFNLTRKDRTIGRGGGVAIYVKETIPLKVQSDLITKTSNAYGLFCG